MKKFLLLIMAAMMAVGMEVRADDGEVETWIDGVRYVVFQSPYPPYDYLAYVIHTSDELTEPSSYTGDIVIPDTVIYESVGYRVKNIYESAFSQSTITSIDIPASVTVINKEAFYNCMSLRKIISRGATPPRSQIISNPDLYQEVFGSLDPSLVDVYVPKGYIEAYQNSGLFWEAFTKYHEIGEEEGIENVQREDAKTRKVIYNGQVYILQEGQTYTLTGKEIK